MKLQEKIDKLSFAERQNLNDGEHTFDELYQMRALTQALLLNTWAHQGEFKVTKTRRGIDGQFFSDGFFLVTANTEKGVIASYFADEFWDKIKVQEVEQAEFFEDLDSQDVIAVMQELLDNG